MCDSHVLVYKKKVGGVTLIHNKVFVKRTFVCKNGYIFYKNVPTGNSFG